VIFTYDECISKYGTKYMVSKAVESGEIYKQEKGIYSDKEYVPALAVIARKYPDAIFTMNSAFYYYDLTDVIPEKFYLATDRDSTKIADKRVAQIFEQRNILELGLTTMDREGYTIRIYSRERLLVEVIRHKRKIPFDYYKEIMRNFREIIYDMDIPAIEEYAYEVPKSSMIMETLRLEVL
jgi:predicted transcriptional regulator of viral defense system